MYYQHKFLVQQSSGLVQQPRTPPLFPLLGSLSETPTVKLVQRTLLLHPTRPSPSKQTGFFCNEQRSHKYAYYIIEGVVGLGHYALCFLLPTPNVLSDAQWPVKI